MLVFHEHNSTGFLYLQPIKIHCIIIGQKFENPVLQYSQKTYMT